LCACFFLLGLCLSRVRVEAVNGVFDAFAEPDVNSAVSGLFHPTRTPTLTPSLTPSLLLSLTPSLLHAFTLQYQHSGLAAVVPELLKTIKLKQAMPPALKARVSEVRLNLRRFIEYKRSQ